ncbi:hypothetical protein [Pseudarthrobacter defluvii]|uniref:hypothetical protein n=1 Tax=Pseudarthrobacter defluvii TaxID=410837 RepID=UPI002577CE0C|nr:hypothetical protein [Pseudarthrobacter defluvii]WJH26073.1 hypothetical protein JCQ34_08585 [Pseudarthrobacter defluvii]
MKRLAAVLIAAPLMLTGCVVPYGRATPSATNAATDGGPTPTGTYAPDAGARTFSTLDKAGIEKIKASKSASFDMTTGWLSKDSVGLEDGSSQAPDVSIKDGTMSVIIEGPTGVVTAQTDRLRMNGMNTGSNFSEVTYFLTAQSLNEYTTIIRDGVDRYGINNEAAEDWIQSISAKPDQKSEFAIGTGTSTGLQVTYDLRYDGAKDTQVIIVHVNPM